MRRPGNYEADMELFCAEENIYEAVRDFYYRLTDEMHDAEFKPGWEKDIYPTQEFLKESIRNKELYYMMEQSEIQACMKSGFRYLTTLKMYYEDTGWTNYKVFEYLV